MSGAKSRNKGARKELGVVHKFQDAALCCRKVSRMYQEGADIEVELDNGRLLTGEVKARKEPTWKRLDTWMRDADFLVLCADRQPPKVYLDLDLFIRLIGGRNA